MRTPPMFYPQEDGKLAEIPAEHAAILDLYRDRMPLVHEPQYSGDPIQLYPLIIEEPEPAGTPEPAALEEVARRTADRMESKRLGGHPFPPDFERLATLAIWAHVEDMATFAGSCSHSDGLRAVERSVRTEAARVGRKLNKTVEKAVRSVTADLIEQWSVTA